MNIVTFTNNNKTVLMSSLKLGALCVLGKHVWMRVGEENKDKINPIGVCLTTGVLTYVDYNVSQLIGNVTIDNMHSTE